MTTHIASDPFDAYDDNPLGEWGEQNNQSNIKFAHGAGATFSLPVAAPAATISTEQFNELSKPKIAFGQTA